jgi:hypothetical protein
MKRFVLWCVRSTPDEDRRLRREAVRLACADFTSAIARMRTLAFKIRTDPADAGPAREGTESGSKRSCSIDYACATLDIRAVTCGFAVMRPSLILGI